MRRGVGVVVHFGIASVQSKSSTVTGNYEKEVAVAIPSDKGFAGSTIFVHTKSRMKNFTFSADENLIEQARLVARQQHRTLNGAFREWLSQFTAQSGSSREYDALMDRLCHVKTGRRFSRDEMNER